MKKLLLTTFATALLTGCGAQPSQESASKTPLKPREPVTLAPVQPVPEATPSTSTAPMPAQPVPEVKPVEPVAKKNKPAEWKAATGRNWDAATRGNTKLIKGLLADGMDIDVTDEGGLTALYRAAHNDQKETVSLLLSNGANVNIRDKFGNTPLDVTLNDNIADLLRKYGGKTGQELKAEGN
ncbi:MAG: ankyrin repeat domain-containing protein [Verrucomicrobiota bacterium]